VCDHGFGADAAREEDVVGDGEIDVVDGSSEDEALRVVLRGVRGVVGDWNSRGWLRVETMVVLEYIC